MNDKEQREGESIFEYDARRADENEADAERLPVAEAALTQCQHIAYAATLDSNAKLNNMAKLIARVAELEKAVEQINSIAEGGAADPEFVAMLAAADREEAGAMNKGDGLRP